MLAERIPAIQGDLAAAGLDGWFFSCFQQNDPISLTLLGIGEGKMVTRRCYYLVPRQGEPKKLVHALEPGMLDHLPGDKAVYLTWSQHREGLAQLVGGHRRLAAQYSPRNEIPTVSRLDAGTAELLRDAGAELVSAADLAQRFAATWSDEQLAGHRRANTHLHAIVLAAFSRVGDALRRGDVLDEYTVQRSIVAAFEQAGLWAEADPIVSVNAHSADPHYQPGPDGSSPIRPGDFLLIDLWAKERRPGSVYADITWCGVCAPSPTARQQEVFATAAAARDAAWDLVRGRFPGRPVQGFEVDDAARGVIQRAGYGDRFIHRTGHGIGVEEHEDPYIVAGNDEPLEPGMAFSVEPGLYPQGHYGARIEDIVVCTEGGARRLNTTSRDLRIVG
jgi:Xaa-Pro aminopeptidase